jgi:ribonuclease P protein subunit RPR2
VIGEQMLANVALLQGEGLKVIRSHHERWDGRGYPDRLRKTETALGGRIFAVADALDAMTTERPYHAPLSWDDALAEIVREARGQFDPSVVDALRDCEPALCRMREWSAAELHPSAAAGGSGIR